MPLRHTLLAALIATSALSGAAVPAMAREGEASLEQRFATPPKEARPRFRWWWPGGAVTDAELPTDLSEGVRIAGAAITAQSGSPSALPSLLPVGIGERNGEFNKIYTDTFQRVVIRGQDIEGALATEGQKLASIMQAAGAACWQP